MQENKCVLLLDKRLQNLVNDYVPNDEILVDDGLIKLKVISKNKEKAMNHLRAKLYDQQKSSIKILTIS